MKIIRYAGLEYKHSSEPTHLYHVEREGSHYLLYYRGGGSLSYEAKMTGSPAEVAAAFDKEVEFMGSGAYHNENWQVATETPDDHAEKILGIFEHPTFGINWEKTGGDQSSEDQFCDMLEKQVKEWKGTAHALSVSKHPYWPKFHAMVKDAVSKEYGSSIRLYRGIRGEQAIPILDGELVKNGRATAWTSDLSSARVYAAGKTKRGNRDWVVVRRNFSPEEILLAPVRLAGPCNNPDILMILMHDVEHYGDEWIVNLPEFIPGDFKIAAKPRGMKSESLLREYIRSLLVRESLEEFSPVLRDEIARAKTRGVSRRDVNSVLARGGDDEQLALEISVLMRTLREAEELANSSSKGLIDFIVLSNQIEGYTVDPQEVSDAIEGINSGYPLTYATNNPYIYSHLAGIEAAKKGAGSVSDVRRIHAAMGADALETGAPGVLRSGVEARSAGGTQYVQSASVPEAISWWAKHGWSDPFEAHTVYELIHPFADGNGRSGRIILAAMMGFNYDAVNGMIGGGYFGSLDSVGEKYQGEFWKE